MTRSFMKYCALLGIACSGFSLADEFLYPVAVTDAHETPYVYLIYQKSLDHLELWIWSPETKVVTKGLFSAFTPAGLRLLPDGGGFSFIDNGRIKIKQFNKRSPKSIDLSEPLYEITLIEWLNGNSFFLSAKERERFSIYQVDTQGNVERIVSAEAIDCLYPQKVGNTLFYIERDNSPADIYRGRRSRLHSQVEQHCRLMSVPYPSIESKSEPSFNDQKHFDEKVALLLQGDQQLKEPLVNDGQKSQLINFGTTPVAFLYMASATEGFFVEYPQEIERSDVTLPFTYHRLRLTDQGWQTQPLFNFEIPLHLLWPSSQSRLYESMLPLLPKHAKDAIHFVNCAHSTAKQSLDVFAYSMSSEKVEQKTRAHKLNEFFFGILPYQEVLFYGGSVDTLVPLEDDGLGGHAIARTVQSNRTPYCWMAEDGLLYLELPICGAGNP